MRLIDADSLVALVNDSQLLRGEFKWAFCALVNGEPSVEPETAKRIVGKSKNGIALWYQCEKCNELVDKKDIFCSGCGRRLVDECTC